MALSPQLQNAINTACTAIAANNPGQNSASWNKTLVNHSTVLPPVGTYYRTKLDRLINGGLGTKTLTGWTVSTVQVAIIKAAWGV